MRQLKSKQSACVAEGTSRRRHPGYACKIRRKYEGMPIPIDNKGNSFNQQMAAAPTTTGVVGTIGEMFPALYAKFKEMLSKFFDFNNLLIIPELCHLSPIIFTIGTFFFALLTLNYPIALFGVASLEAMLVYSPLAMLGAYFLKPDDLRPGEEALGNECTSRFQKMNQYRFKDILQQGLKPEFPHYGLYFLSFASGYMIQSMNFLSEEISLMGEQYSNRLYLSILAAAMFIAVYLVHLVMYGCNTTSSLVFTGVIGIFVGIFISLLHYSLGGKQAVNVLFVPPIVKRDGLDFLCVKTA
jgi:hypothetical protein